MTAVPAAATAETAPLGGLLGDGGGLVGTNAQCDDGLLGIALGGSPVCVLPSVEGGPGANPCPDGVASIALAGQGVACVAPGQQLTGGEPCPPSLASRPAPPR